MHFETKTLKKKLLGDRRKRCVSFQANRCQTSALFQDAFHMLAIIVIHVFGAVVIRINIGITGDTNHTCAFGGVHRKDVTHNSFQGVFKQDELSAFAWQGNNTLCLTRKRYQSEGGIFSAKVLFFFLVAALGFFGSVFFVQTKEYVECAVFEMRERMARVNNLRRKVRNYLSVEIFTKIGCLFLV